MKIIYLIIISFVYTNVFSQSNNFSINEKNYTNSSRVNKIEFLSSPEIFTPLKASIFESRIGGWKDLNNNLVRLDIGYSPDLITFRSRNSVSAVGVDFFTFSSLRSESNFKFPVEAIDYNFGVKYSYSKHLNKKLSLEGRFRLAHISAHLQDGYIYPRTDTIFTPFVYSREYIDLSAILNYKYSKRIFIRTQVSLNYLINSKPDEFGKFYLQFGFENFIKVYKNFNFYFSNEFRLVSVKSSTNLNYNLETGFKIGGLNNRGLSLFFTLYDGQDYRGQFYDKYLNYKSIGFTFDI
ncbi:MAG TPA: DUF1207 domain-containing protein [Ignavibacteria bacterium]|nr:DUF1207 domain-containing protein [Ignavibacteria bacterium]